MLKTRRTKESVDVQKLKVGRINLLDYALSSLVERTVDSEDIQLTEELLEVFDSSSLDGGLSLSGERLVIVCEKESNQSMVKERKKWKSNSQ